MADAASTREIVDFVLMLSQNPDKATQYKANPSELMTAEGISASSQQEILAAQQTELTRRTANFEDGDTANNDGGGGSTVIVAVIVVSWPDSTMPQGRLFVVGTGITAGQMTIESQNACASADLLLTLVADPLTTHYLQSLNTNIESLQNSYQDGQPRFAAYTDMVNRILEPVRAGLTVCAAFYGHPGVFAYPSHESVRVARAEGYSARMLPGVSAEDCLFADLGLDPSLSGCQSFEATDFLIHNRAFDPTSSLVIWQVGVIGDLSFSSAGHGSAGLAVLTERLLPSYSDSHPVVLYEAAHSPLGESRMQRLPLGELPRASVNAITTMYVPPDHSAQPDQAVLDRLGMARDELKTVEMRLATADS
ncbi:MAG: SAM-dependent methyltransferase [Jatrophihabitans sp.]